MDLTFTRLLDSVKYESGTFTAGFCFQFCHQRLDGIYLWNIVFVDQGLCKWILLASNSGTFAQNSLGNIRDYFIRILFEFYAIKSCSEGFFFCFRDSQFFP